MGTFGFPDPLDPKCSWLGNFQDALGFPQDRDDLLGKVLGHFEGLGTIPAPSEPDEPPMIGAEQYELADSTLFFFMHFSE